MIINNSIANLISALHLILIILIISLPFSNTPLFLFLHCVFIPFIIFHWLVHDDTCVLTIIEKKLRGITNNDDVKKKCYTQQLLSPIFNFANNYNDFSKFTYISIIILLSISFSKLIYMCKSKQINNIYGLCKLY
jgi:hypothetical protein